MSRFVCYIPSYNDSTLVAQSLASVPEWEVVISDNTSNRDHALAIEQLSGPLVRVVHQPRQLGRVGNWKFCVEHFLASGATWMKFLMAGDRLKPNSLSLCRRAVSQFPDVRSIVFNVEIVNSQGATRWSTATQPRVLAPRESMLEIVRGGNVFFGLLAALVHADTVGEGFSFGGEILSYCADMYFQVEIGRRWPTLFYPDVLAEFVTTNRKTYSAGQFSLEHLVEEVLVKLRAGGYYAELTDDYQTQKQIPALLGTWLRGGLDHLQSRQTGET